MARRPTTRISRLTTAAKTGRRMKRSVNFIGGPLLIDRLRRGVVGRHDAIVDGERHAVAQLDLARRYDRVAVCDALQDGDLIAARGTRRDEDLAGDEQR